MSYLSSPPPTTARYEDIRGVLLAGGKQNRLASLGIAMPKSLLVPYRQEVGKIVLTQMLQHVPSALLMAGKSATYLSRAFSRNGLITSTDPVLGTGMAAWLAAQQSEEAMLLLANADTLNEPGIIAKVLELGDAQREEAVIGLTRRQNDVQNAGAFAVGNNAIVLRSFEDGLGGTLPSNTIWTGGSTGIILIPRQVILDIVGDNWREMLSLEKDIIPALIRRQKLLAADCGYAFSLDIGTPERLASSVRLRSEIRKLENSHPAG